MLIQRITAYLFTHNPFFSVLIDAEKGCHVLHILSAVRQRYSLNLSKSALELVLKSLECNSDIISSSDDHYTML